MKDHEIIAQIGKLLDGADAPTRASVEAWLRSRLSVAAPAPAAPPDLAEFVRKLVPPPEGPRIMPPSIIPGPPYGEPWQPRRPWELRPPWEQTPWYPRGIEFWCGSIADRAQS